MLRFFLCMDTLFAVKDKVVVVAGCLGRIGVGLADCLVQEGAIVILLGSCLVEGQALVEGMVMQGGEAFFYLADPFSKQQLIQIQEDVMLEYGHIDALLYELDGMVTPLPACYASGTLVLADGPLENPKDEWLDGLFLSTRIFLRSMLKQETGSIVLLLDYAAPCLHGNRHPHQQMTADLGVLTHSLASELALNFSPSYRVNALVAGNASPANFNPVDMLGTLQYLISDASSLVTGEVMLVDGGFHIFADKPTSLDTHLNQLHV